VASASGSARLQAGRSSGDWLHLAFDALLFSPQGVHVFEAQIVNLVAHRQASWQRMENQRQRQECMSLQNEVSISKSCPVLLGEGAASAPGNGAERGAPNPFPRDRSPERAAD